MLPCSRISSHRQHAAPPSSRSTTPCSSSLYARSSSALRDGRSRKGAFVCAASNHYEQLGLEAGASEEEVKAAFRRKAKELHPDVNTEEGAEATFMAAKQAYEVLSDPQRRAEYDATLSVRRIGFFRDVLEEEAAAQEDEEEAGSNPWTQHRRMWEDLEQQQAGSGSSGAEDPAEMLERLARVMGAFPGGGLSAYQAGRLDPWGTSSSDTWFRRVEQQSQNPGLNRGRGAPGGWDEEGGGGAPEWSPYRRGDDVHEERTGWRPPGRGSEWSHPRRQWEEEDPEGPPGRGRGPGRRGGGGRGGGLGGDFGGQPLRR